MCVVKISLVIVVEDIVCLANSLESDLSGGALNLRYFVRVTRKRSLQCLSRGPQSYRRGTDFMIGFLDLCFARASLNA